MSTASVERIIQRFGKMSDMARALGHKNPTTIQGWKERGSIPSRQIPLVIEVLHREKGIELTLADFFEAESDDSRPDHAAFQTEMEKDAAA